MCKERIGLYHRNLMGTKSLSAIELFMNCGPKMMQANISVFYLHEIGGTSKQYPPVYHVSYSHLLSA